LVWTTPDQCYHAVPTVPDETVCSLLADLQACCCHNRTVLLCCACSVELWLVHERLLGAYAPLICIGAAEVHSRALGQRSQRLMATTVSQFITFASQWTSVDDTTPTGDPQITNTPSCAPAHHGLLIDTGTLTESSGSSITCPRGGCWADCRQQMQMQIADSSLPRVT
jgi:hypothetical protein